jgi:hypothetical protein
LIFLLRAARPVVCRRATAGPSETAQPGKADCIPSKATKVMVSATTRSDKMGSVQLSSANAVSNAVGANSLNEVFQASSPSTIAQVPPKEKKVTGVATPQPGTGSTWSKIKTSKGIGDVKIPPKSSFLGVSPGSGTPAPSSARPVLVSPQVIAQNKAAPAGPLEKKLKQQMEVMAQDAGMRSVKNMVTVPETSPLNNEESAKLWKKMNNVAFASSGGKYGISESGQSGSNGSVVKLYGAENLVARTKELDLAGVGAYSLLGACAGWNLNLAGGMNLIQRIVQVPAGIIRDVANLGANKLDTSGLGNVWLEAGVKGGGGAVITVGSNWAVGKIGKIVDPNSVKGWAPDSGFRKGMVKASFSVNLTVTALNEMEKVGWLGGKLPANPTKSEKLFDTLKKASAIGGGVFIAIAPVVKAAGGNRFAIGSTFFLPFAQTFLGVKITEGINDKIIPLGTPGNLNSNTGNKKIQALNIKDALRNGNNPYELADSNRTRTGKYQNLGEPTMSIANAVLELQNMTRPTTVTPNVRSNGEAVAVIERALALERAGTLKEPAKKKLSELFANLNANKMFFGSNRVKKEATISISTNSSALPSFTVEQQDFVRQVFSGSFRKTAGQIRPDNLGVKAIDLVSTMAIFLFPKVAGPVAAVVDNLVNPEPVANGELNLTTYPGFAARVKAKYGNVYAVLGEKPPSYSNLTAPQKQTVDLLLMKLLYRAVREVVDSRPGSATQHGSDNVPSRHGANGGYFFTALERMTPAEKTSVQIQMKKDFEEVKGKALNWQKGNPDRTIKAEFRTLKALPKTTEIPVYRPFNLGESRNGP